MHSSAAFALGNRCERFFCFISIFADVFQHEMVHYKKQAGLIDNGVWWKATLVVMVGILGTGNRDPVLRGKSIGQSITALLKGSIFVSPCGVLFSSTW